MIIAAVMVVGAATAPFVAWRVKAHRHILGGFLGGVLLSATVSLMQGLDIPTLQSGNQETYRYPGLASTTMLITWHLAFGLIVACYFLAQRASRASTGASPPSPSPWAWPRSWSTAPRAGCSA